MDGNVRTKTDDEIKAMVRAAFKPLLCVPDVWDYGYRLRFKVLNKKGTSIVDMQEVVLDEEAQLREALVYVRQRLLDKGYRLDPWEWELK